MPKSTLRNLEYNFCNRINSDGNLSADLQTSNGYTDIVCITSVKTGKSISVNFDYVSREISFWDNCDNKFSFEMNEKAMDELFKAMDAFMRHTFYFQAVKSDIKTSFIKTIDKPSTNLILENVKEILPYIDDGFDHIDVFDFLGNYNYRFNDI